MRTSTTELRTALSLITRDPETMSDTEREIVRGHLRWRTHLVARSEGEDPERHVVVIPI